MRLDAGSEEEAVVNLVPLLDVMFLLLIFFLVSTTFTKDEVDMNLVLPEARSGAPAESGNLLVINVAQDGAITVDGRPVATMEALRQKLRAAASRNRDQQVLIRGDTRVQFGLVAQALDACLGASLKRVAIRARPAEAR
ncbi:MAG: biopolymer transporter ExbD [Planctomycetota bacterium]